MSSTRLIVLSPSIGHVYYFCNRLAPGIVCFYRYRSGDETACSKKIALPLIIVSILAGCNIIASKTNVLNDDKIKSMALALWVICQSVPGLNYCVQSALFGPGEIAEQDIAAARWAGVELRIRPCNRRGRVDATLLVAVVKNILSNALKYAPNHPVLIGVRNHKGALSISVHDQSRASPPSISPTSGMSFIEYVTSGTRMYKAWD